MSSRRGEIVYGDTETTGLIVGYHEPFELVFKHQDEVLTIWLDVDLKKASPEALKKNRYYERAEECRAKYLMAPDEAAWKIAKFTSGRTLAGDNPRFDADMVEAFLSSQGLQPAWAHNLIDVPVYAAGALGLRSPWTYRDIMKLLGVEQADDAQHTALGDVLRTEAIHKAAMRLRDERSGKVAKVFERLFTDLAAHAGEALVPTAAAGWAVDWAAEVEAAIQPVLKEKA